MKFSYISVIFIFLNCFNMPVYSELLSSVTRVPDITKFFLEMYTAHRQTEEEILKEYEEVIGSPQNLHDWSFRMCRSIFTTNQFFQMRFEHFVSTLYNDQSLQKEMSLFYNSIYNNYYQYVNPARDGRGVKDEIFKIFAELHKALFEPRAKLLSQKFIIDGIPVEDIVFTCLCRNHRTGGLKQYFISSIYHKYRFIYDYDKNGALYILAVVELGNLFVNSPQNEIDKKYLKQREALKGRKVFGKNLICEQNEADNLLTCHKIINSFSSLGNVNFWPTLYNVDYTCQEKDVRIMNPRIDQNSTSEVRLYKEWVIGCKARNIHPYQTQNIFYVSESYTFSEYIVMQGNNEVTITSFVPIYHYHTNSHEMGDM